MRDVRALVGSTPRISYSAHSVSEAGAAVEEGADAVVLGPVYPTASHPERAPLGRGAVLEAARLPVPIVAIGGITPERAREMRAAGAAAVAVLSGVWGAPAGETASRVRGYQAAWFEE